MENAALSPKMTSIMFSTAMVQAILDGRKVVTRRVVGDQPNLDVEGWRALLLKKCRFGVAGDLLWVRETYYAYGRWVYDRDIDKYWFEDLTCELKDGYLYAADGDISTKKLVLGSRTSSELGWYKRSALFMPKHASRLLLKIDSVDVELLRDIQMDSAVMEGIERSVNGYWKDYLDDLNFCFYPTRSFKSLWDSIYGVGSFEAMGGLFVYVIKFNRVKYEHL